MLQHNIQSICQFLKGGVNLTGTVKWFNAEKGFGFITDDEGNDHFVHYTSIDMDGFKTLEENAKVTFETEVTEKGSVAKNVKLA